MDYLKRAKELKDELIKNRRTIHGFAEIRFDLPQTVKFVKDKLREYGCEPVDVGKSGVSCVIGRGGKTILLRCDMDALPMREESGLDFAATNGNCHSCGHDTHTAMLLCAAKMLKEREKELKGTVKLMFQPAEERLKGAMDMIDAGILENPHVDAAIGMHIFAGTDYSPSGHILFRSGLAMNSATSLTVKVKGVAAHGSTPFRGVDAINIAAHIVIALQEIIAREIPAEENAVILVGTISGGTTSNTVSAEAALGVSVRAENSAVMDNLIQRIRDLSKSTAEGYRGSVSIDIDFSAPPVINDSKLTEELKGYAATLLPKDSIHEYPKQQGSEDFSCIAERVPSTFIVLNGGSIEEGYAASQHNPKVIYNESTFPVGAATMAHCAEEWLKNN